MGQPALVTYADGIILLIWLIVFSVGVIVTIIGKEEIDEDISNHDKHSRFWLGVAGLLAFLTVIGPMLLESIGFALFNKPAAIVIVVIFCLGLFSVTVIPNYVKHRDKYETIAVIIFLTYVFPVLLICVFFTLPPIGLLINMAIAFTLEYVGTVLIVTLGSYDLLLRIAKSSITPLILFINFCVLVLVIMGLVLVFIPYVRDL